MTIEEEISIAEAANAGNVGAQLQYGKMLLGLSDRVVDGFDGIEVVRYQDMSKDGMGFLEKAAASGNGEAKELLLRIKNGEIHMLTEPEHLFKKAMKYIAGEEVERDLSRAAKLLYEVADRCSMYKDARPDAYRELANLCSQVESKDYMFGEEPMEWLCRLARADVGERQHLFAIMRVAGDGEENWGFYPVGDSRFSAGLEWVRRDADAGNPVSQYQYGEILIWACDIEETMNDGLEYLRRACENGYAKAAIELGVLHIDTSEDWGGVFNPDRSEAVKWFERAAELGSDYARDILRKLS